MKKCSRCGALNNDSSKFCAECGTKLAAEEQSEPVRTQSVDPFADNFVPLDAGSVPPRPESQLADPFDERETAHTGSSVTVEKSKLAKTADGVIAFEKKHFLVTNLVLLVTAVIMLFLSLLAPMKIMGYFEEPVVDSVQNAGNGDAPHTEVTQHYLEIDQPVWRYLANIDCLFTPEYETRAANAMLAYENAKREAEDDLRAWMALRPNATEKERERALAHFFEDRLSSIDYIAYLRALALKNDGQVNVFVGTFSNSGAMFLTLLLQISAACVLSGLSIVALVYMIFGIVGAASKRRLKNPFTFIQTALHLIASVLMLNLLSPMGKVGGGPLAIFAVGALAYLAGSVLIRLALRETPKHIVLKRGLISAVSFVAAGLLFTDVFMYSDGTTGVISSAPVGYGLFKMYDIIVNGTGGAESSAFEIVSIAVNGIMLLVLGAITFSLAVSIVSHNINAVRAPGSAALEGDMASGSSIAMFVISTVSIAYSFVMPLMIRAVLQLENTVPLFMYYFAPQVYVSAALSLACGIFGNVYMPEKRFSEQSHADPAPTVSAPTIDTAG